MIRTTTLILALVTLTSLAGCAASPEVVLEPPRDLHAEAEALVDMRVDMSHPRLLAGSDGSAVVWLEIEGREPAGEEHRVGLNFSLVLDHSGSMGQAQLEDAKSAALYMLSELHPDDRVSVVAFSSRVEVLQPQQRWGDVDTEALREAITALEPRGTTAMYQALAEGHAQVYSAVDPRTINRILLFSDGVPNDATHLQGLADAARSNQIGITTMGLGPQYNEDLMTRLADSSGGNYHFIARSEHIQDAFLAEKHAMERTLARNASLTFTLGHGVRVRQAYGAQIQAQNARSMSLFLGEIAVGEVREIALELEVAAPERAELPVEILDASLAWQDVLYTTGQHEAYAYVGSTSTGDAAVVEQHVNESFLMKLSDLKAAALIDEALRAWEEGQVRAAKLLLEDGAKAYRDVNALDTAWAPGEDRSLNIGALGGRPDQVMESLSGELDTIERDSDEASLYIKQKKRSARSAMSLY